MARSSPEKQPAIEKQALDTLAEDGDGSSNQYSNNIKAQYLVTTDINKGDSVGWHGGSVQATVVACAYDLAYVIDGIGQVQAFTSRVQSHFIVAPDKG